MKYHEKALSYLAFMVLCTFKLQTDMEEFTKLIYVVLAGTILRSRSKVLLALRHTISTSVHPTKLFKLFKRVNQMAQLIKALSSILRTYMVEGENLFPQAVI